VDEARWRRLIAELIGNWAILQLGGRTMTISDHIASAKSLLLGQSDWVAMAQTKCEFALESFMNFDIRATEVALATVIGDVSNGTVNLPFADSGKQRLEVCVFASGKTQSVRLDGSC
jgi:hypothetical protein